jgi:hypothetical protein
MRSFGAIGRLTNRGEASLSLAAECGPCGPSEPAEIGAPLFGASAPPIHHGRFMRRCIAVTTLQGQADDPPPPCQACGMREREWAPQNVTLEIPLGVLSRWPLAIDRDGSGAVLGLTGPRQRLRGPLAMRQPHRRHPLGVLPHRRLGPRPHLPRRARPDGPGAPEGPPSNSVRLNFCVVVELSDASGQYTRSMQLPWPIH